MYAFLNELLSDHTGGTVFTCFGFWHFCWLIGMVLGTAVVGHLVYAIFDAVHKVCGSGKHLTAQKNKITCKERANAIK